MSRVSGAWIVLNNGKWRMNIDINYLTSQIMPRTRLRSTYNLFDFIVTPSDLVSEVLSHISFNEDSVGLDRIELQEGRMEDVCETLFLINQRLNDILKVLKFLNLKMT